MSEIIHSYKSINWDYQQKANLHTHTKSITINDAVYGSDGALTQQEAIDAYYQAGYKILAITDHDTIDTRETITYPWTLFGRNPSTLGMLAIPGQEFSDNHHRLSLFNEIPYVSKEHHSLSSVKDAGGIMILSHPGRYGAPQYIDSWYTMMSLAYPNTLIGLEVYNMGNRYPYDKKLWDRVNSVTIPLGKVVWGFSNDDMHSGEHLFRNYQFVLPGSDTVSSAAIKAALLAGKTYFCYEPLGSGEAKAPRITNIVVDEGLKTVTITADSGVVKWVTENTLEVGTGNTFDYTGFDKLFFRAEIENDFGVACTQPFVFMHESFKTEVEEICVKDSEIWEYIEKAYAKQGIWFETESIKIRE